jgi:hypothetical protein
VKQFKRQRRVALSNVLGSDDPGAAGDGTVEAAALTTDPNCLDPRVHLTVTKKSPALRFLDGAAREFDLLFATVTHRTP